MADDLVSMFCHLCRHRNNNDINVSTIAFSRSPRRALNCYAMSGKNDNNDDNLCDVTDKDDD